MIGVASQNFIAMEILALQILREISECGLSAIYGDELNRVWPNNEINIRQSIEQFAMDHGWRLRHYKEGSIAIFDKESGQALRPSS